MFSFLSLNLSGTVDNTSLLQFIHDAWFPLFYVSPKFSVLNLKVFLGEQKEKGIHQCSIYTASSLTSSLQHSTKEICCRSVPSEHSVVNSISFAFCQLFACLRSLLLLCSNIHKLYFKACNGVFLFFLFHCSHQIKPPSLTHLSDFQTNILMFGAIVLFHRCPPWTSTVFHWNSSHSLKKILTLMCTKNTSPPKKPSR